jgi:ornithine carbamoyltransferase
MKDLNHHLLSLRELDKDSLFSIIQKGIAIKQNPKETLIL